MQSSSSEPFTPGRRTSTKATSPSASLARTVSTGQSQQTHDNERRKHPIATGPRVSIKWTPDASPLATLQQELRTIRKGEETGRRQLESGIARSLSKEEEERIRRSAAQRAKVEINRDGTTGSQRRITLKNSRGALKPSSTSDQSTAPNSQNASQVYKQHPLATQNEEETRIPTTQPVKRSTSSRRRRHMRSMDLDGAADDEARHRRDDEEGDNIGRLRIRDKDLSGQHRSDSIIHAHPDEARMEDLGRDFLFSPGQTTPNIHLEPDSIEYGTLRAGPATTTADRGHPTQFTLDVGKLDTLSSEDSYMIGRAMLRGRKQSTVHRMSVYDPKLSVADPEEEDQELIWLTAISARPIPDPQLFNPPVAIRCGPLLRYKGMRRESVNSGYLNQTTMVEAQMEVWRGSVMIVTVDDESSYLKPPTLRLFAQPISALQDPNSPVETPRVFKMKDGEARNKFCTVKGTKLNIERGHTFWRFDLEIELCDKEARIAYKVNRGPSFAFYVPARSQSFNIMFHSCNGFSLSIDPDTFKGTNPLWRDALNNHTKRPFHVMLGGGDQLYNDAVTKQTTLFREWLSILNPITKHKAPFTPEIADELESFYLNRYCDWFSQGLFGVAIAQIPMVNIWDDHDIIDGFGSYPSHFNRCPVFSGLGNVAFKYYMLFQHQSLVEEEERHEPSWVIGHAPGPYIHERSRNTFMFLGRKIAFLGLDCRTERMRGQIVSAETYGIVFDRLRQEIVPGETKHLLVMLGVPIAYPRLVWLENLLTSRVMDPIKFLARIGVIDGFLNTFDGGVEILDDLDDHWTAKNHKQERNAFIEELQELAMEKSVRITILGGDVHLAGIGRFYSNPDRDIHVINDFRYMPNVISSAIVNAPPPNTMADVLNKRNKVHHLNADTDEDMIPIFPVDVDGKPRNNKRMMPRRNYCTINAYTGVVKNTVEVPPQQKEKPPKGIMKLFKKESDSGSGGGSLHGPRRALTESFFTDQADVPLEDALEINLRVELNQKDEEGKTRAYQFLVPRLDCEDGIADVDILPPQTNHPAGHWI